MFPLPLWTRSTPPWTGESEPLLYWYAKYNNRIAGPLSRKTPGDPGKLFYF